MNKVEISGSAPGRPFLLLLVARGVDFFSHTTPVRFVQLNSGNIFLTNAVCLNLRYPTFESAHWNRHWTTVLLCSSVGQKGALY